MKNLNFHYADPPEWFFSMIFSLKAWAFYGLVWQFYALSKARELLKEERFDIVQHLTYGNLWLPSFFFLLPCAYVLGPVGGGVVARAMSREYSLRGRITEIIREAVLRSMKWINIPILLNMAKAKIILARTGETVGFLPQWARAKARVIPETALDISHFAFEPRLRQEACHSAKIIIVYAGRILALKNLHIAIHAFLKFMSTYPELAGQVHFDIYGDGPHYSICRDVAGNEAGRSVVFHGRIERDLLLEKLKSAHLFVHLSAKDTAATGPMEAMALGLPVVCLKVGGMADLVNESCGYAIYPGSPEQIINRVVEILHEVVTNRELLIKLSLGAREKVESSFTWQRRIEQYNMIIRDEVLFER